MLCKQKWLQLTLTINGFSSFYEFTVGKSYICAGPFHSNFLQILFLQDIMWPPDLTKLNKYTFTPTKCMDGWFQEHRLWTKFQDKWSRIIHRFMLDMVIIISKVIWPDARPSVFFIKELNYCQLLASYLTFLSNCYSFFLLNAISFLQCYIRRIWSL